MQTPRDFSPTSRDAGEDEQRAARAAARGSWPVRRCVLGEEPAEELTATTTPSERLIMVWGLTLDAWALSGKPMPDYSREEAPGRVIRPPRQNSSDAEHLMGDEVGNG